MLKVSMKMQKNKQERKNEAVVAKKRKENTASGEKQLLKKLSKQIREQKNKKRFKEYLKTPKESRTYPASNLRKKKKNTHH